MTTLIGARNEEVIWNTVIITVVACAPAHAGSTIVQGKVTQVKPVCTQVS